jgi:1-acyl-sn-glycerol-3-phosphate acyltransferase
MKLLSSAILTSFGWKVVTEVDLPTKSVICVAPHTSNWDFVIGQLYAWATGIKSSFLMKDSWFFFPLASLFKRMGGIPVNRSQKNAITATLIELCNNSDSFFLTITPEGTRSLVEQWKTGFYNIAVGANVPIILAFIDYKRKEVGIKHVFIPTGDIDIDLPVIQSYYKADMALHPEKFNTSK